MSADLIAAAREYIAAVDKDDLVVIAETEQAKQIARAILDFELDQAEKRAVA
jgi:hypothetical protein